jgi:hypothetical protein
VLEVVVARGLWPVGRPSTLLSADAIKEKDRIGSIVLVELMTQNYHI